MLPLSYPKLKSWVDGGMLEVRYCDVTRGELRYLVQSKPICGAQAGDSLVVAGVDGRLDAPEPYPGSRYFVFGA